MNGYSVLIPVYCGESADLLAECLASLAQQAPRPTEVVIVEDGPVPEALRETVAAAAHALAIRTVRSARHRGLGPALNDGLAACANDIVCRMDADDIAVDGRFGHQIEHLLRHDLEIVGAQIEEFDGVSGRPLRRRSVPLARAEILRHALYRNPLNHMTACFRRGAIVAIGGYRDVPGMEDYDLWLRALQHGLAIENLPAVLVRARVSEGTVMRRHGWEYCRREWELGRTKVGTGLWPAWRVWAVTLLRSAARLLPLWGLRWLYAGALRSRLVGP